MDRQGLEQLQRMKDWITDEKYNMRPALIASLMFIHFFTSGMCARILVVLPFPGRSHHMFATAILDALAERGHSIIEYSPFPPKHPRTNHTHHIVRSAFEQDIDKQTFDYLKEEAATFDSSIFGANVKRIWAMTDAICEDTFRNENFLKLLQSDEKIDLVMAETMFGQESLLVLGHIFAAPTVILESSFPNSLVNWVAGNALSIASVPDKYAMVMNNEEMTFLERTLNLISTVRTLYLYHTVHLPKQDLIMRQSLPSGLREVPPLSQLVANVSLYLLNSHPAAVNYLQPYTPYMVAVGGINIGYNRDLLTEELQTFMDDSPDGVIYFSLGTVIPAHSMPNEVLQLFINVFGRLPQKVLWKIDLARRDFPPNVKTVKWAPQLEVLGHRRCILFITHGGLNSHQEAMYAGVPTVGVPLFADQPYNARYGEHRGTGRQLALATLSEQSLYDAIAAVLSDPKYGENAKRMSKIYRDRPIEPKDSAVYWVEYVLRHRGAPHLRPASVTMVWYKLMLLDVITLAVAAVFIVAIILYKSLSCGWAFYKRRAIVSKGKKIS